FADRLRRNHSHHDPRPHNFWHVLRHLAEVLRDHVTPGGNRFIKFSAWQGIESGQVAFPFVMKSLCKNPEEFGVLLPTHQLHWPKVTSYRAEEKRDRCPPAREEAQTEPDPLVSHIFVSRRQLRH